MQKITTFLWFDHQAEEAANFYVSLFKNSKILSVTRNGDGGTGPAESALVVNFQLEGIEYIAINGGPMFKFTEAISLHVSCETQQEIDELWEKLSAGGEKGRCSWLKDKYGLSWQVDAKVLGEMLSDQDCARADRVMKAVRLSLANCRKLMMGKPERQANQE